MTFRESTRTGEASSHRGDRHPLQKSRHEPCWLLETEAQGFFITGIRSGEKWQPRNKDEQRCVRKLKGHKKLG